MKRDISSVLSDPSDLCDKRPRNEVAESNKLCPATLYGKNSLFFSKVQESQKTGEDITRYVNPSVLGKNLYKHEFLFVPVNHQNFHWYLLVIRINKVGDGMNIGVVVFDSIDDSNEMSKHHELACITMIKFIRRHINGAGVFEDDGIRELEFEYERRVTASQDDGFNCGLYVVAQMRAVCLSGTLNPSSFDAQSALQWRRELFATLLPKEIRSIMKSAPDSPVDDFNTRVNLFSTILCTHEKMGNGSHNVCLKDTIFTVCSRSISRLKVDSLDSHSCYFDDMLMDMACCEYVP